MASNAAMQIIGPLWREKPTTSATFREFAWCNLWIKDGQVVAIEWIEK